MPSSIAAENLAIFLAEIHALAAHLKYARQPFQNQEDWPSGARSVLLILGRSGAQTVPEIARERSTSRQNIQIVVNRLKKAGLAALEINPTHKRSALVRLTESGKSLLKHLEEAETVFQGSMLAQLSAEELASTTKCLRKIRQVVAGDLNGHGSKKPTPRVAAPPVVPEEAPPEEEGFPINLL
jgi:DNA-binding MarR family transcriptional regulator